MNKYKKDSVALLAGAWIVIIKKGKVSKSWKKI